MGRVIESSGGLNRVDNVLEWTNLLFSGSKRLQGKMIQNILKSCLATVFLSKHT